MRSPCVYIVASQRNGTLHTGLTSNLAERVQQHRNGVLRGFTKLYDCKLLVRCEHLPTMLDAITREKLIKGGSRKRKLALIEAVNPAWTDLYEKLNG